MNKFIPLHSQCFEAGKWENKKKKKNSGEKRTNDYMFSLEKVTYYNCLPTQFMCIFLCPFLWKA